MHGTVFAELKRYVAARLGAGSWPALPRRAGLEDRIYLATETCPDEELAALVRSTSALSETPAPRLLEDFGRFIAPDLLRMHRALIRPAWRTLDVLEHTEDVVHTAVRSLNKGAAPPRLKARRTSTSEVTIVYDSPRRLRALARGIPHGVADHFKERLSLQEPACMHKGDPACRLVFRLEASAS